MATRHSRFGESVRPRRRRWAVFSLGMLAILATVAWIAPGVVALTALRDRPLQAAFAGIDGGVSSRAAVWQWWGVIEYRDVVLADREGRPLVAVPRVVIDRGLVNLVWNPTDLGAVRLIGGEALVEIRRGGSTIEDVLAPWLAAALQTRSLPASFELEVVDAAVELVDLERHDAWRISDIVAAGTVRPDATIAGWTVSGRARHAGTPVRDLLAAANRVPSERIRQSAGPSAAGPDAAERPADDGARAVPRPDAPARLDRTTVAAGATAILARDGGWSVSSPESPAAGERRSLAVAATRLPLGISSVVATRFDAAHLLDGVAVAGVVTAAELSVRRADTRAALVAVDRGEMPIDLSLVGDRVVVRSLKLSSPLVRAEASGRIRMPHGSGWEWAEALVGDDFAVAADIDLAAAARAAPGGLVVRPDVRITGGLLQLSAVARPDGNDRVLEVRAGSRDVAAVQSVVPPPGSAEPARGRGKREAGGIHERPLRWSEPFAAWVRGRRAPGRGERLRIEEARIASAALEVSAVGTVEASSVQWTLDLDRLMAEAGEVLQLEGVKLAGTARGRCDVERVAATGGSLVKAAASVSNLEVVLPGRPPWRDGELSITAEGSGGLAGGAVIIDQGHAVVGAADDTLELTLGGGVLVNPWAVLFGSGRSAAPWLRAAAVGQAIAADVSLQGNLASWQPRFEAVCGPSGLARAEMEGFAKVAATLAAEGDSWRITRAGGEVEKLAVKLHDRRIEEPRAVVTAAGRWHPATAAGDISSAELLTATLSLRTGGLSVLPARRPPAGTAAGEAGQGGGADGLVGVLERLRGKVQWQADVSRLERWLVPSEEAARWPAGGRAWGTAEVLDTPIGLNVLVEATGSQLALSRRDAAGTVPLWSEPRATLAVEVTRSSAEGGERMTVNQLKLESSTLAVAAAGSIVDPASRRLVELGGSLAYDWDQVSRLLTPWTGGRLRLSGAGARPFAVRGPLGRIAAAALAAPPSAAIRQFPLPDDWLAAGRGTAADPADKVARVALPVPRAAQEDGGLADRLRAVSLDTSAAWTAAEVAGFQLAAGEMPVRLFEGQLALGPFDLAASGGRLRGAPWLKLLPGPTELVVPPGRCLDRVVLSPQMCDRWVTWLVPLVGHSTHTRGLASIDLAGARLPLRDPFGGEASGQVLFENLEATPGEHVRPLVNLVVKLQSAIDPRFAFGDKTVLMRVRPEPVTIRLADRRIWHEGLVMDAGQLVIRSGGSVGADGSLAMVVEIAFRGDIAGATPVVGQLLRTPLAIPLKGTVHRPQFDARSLDVILGRIVENTTEAVFGPKLTRDLEALFGNPQPAEGSEPPLAFPPQAQ